MVVQHDGQDTRNEKDSARDIGDDLKVLGFNLARALDTATNGFEFIRQEWCAEQQTEGKYYSTHPLEET